QLAGEAASCNFFDVLGERPALGRTFVKEDCRAPGASPVVVLSDDLWRSRFGADPQIVGKSVSLSRAKFTVIGVAAPGFRGLDPWPSEFWAPVTMQKALQPDADLLLERASARQKEIAIRLSIGGSRGRIVRQLLTESLLIAFLGGTLGSLVAFWSVGGLARYVLAHLPLGAPQLVWNVSPDLHVWGYSLALTA